MKVEIKAADRKLLRFLLPVFLALLLLSVLLQPPTRENPLGLPSTYSTEEDGAKAAYLFLRESGYEVERWERPATALEQAPADGVYILAAPSFPSTAADRQAVLSYLLRGGWVLATGSSGASWLPAANLEGLDSPSLDRSTHYASSVGPISLGAPAVVMRAWVRWRTDNPSHIVVHGTRERPVVVTYTVGQGRVVWWADANPLTNAGILQANNFRLFLNSLDQSQPRHIFWDEYYHGLQGTLLTYLGRTPLGWGLAQAGLLLLFSFIAFGRRYGPARPLERTSRLSPLEFVEALGDLYRSARVGVGVVSSAHQRFRHLLARRLGIPAATRTEELYRTIARRWDAPLPDLYQTLKQCEMLPPEERIHNIEALLLVQSLQDYTEILQLSPKPHTESKHA